MSLTIRSARPDDSALVFALVRELADYEKLTTAVVATEEQIAAALFSAQPRLFCDIGEWNGEPAGFAVWFLNFSTFRGRHGIYLEDIFVRPAYRRRGIGKALLKRLAQRCLDKGYAPLRVGGARLERRRRSNSIVRLAPRSCPSGKSANSVGKRCGILPASKDGVLSRPRGRKGASARASSICCRMMYVSGYRFDVVGSGKPNRAVNWGICLVTASLCLCCFRHIKCLDESDRDRTNGKADESDMRHGPRAEAPR